MKTVLIFLLCLAPLAGGLWLLGADDARPDHLPAESPADGGDGPVLDGTDFVGRDEPAAFPGRVQRLSDITVRVLDEGYVHYYLRVERLARDDGAPRLDDVTCAVYDPPRDGQPQLRLTFHAPAVHGDPYVLLRGPKDEPKIAELRGGVVARDPAGRTLAEIASLSVNLTGHTVRSADTVKLHWPDRGAHLSGVGLEGHLDMRRVTLLREVRATVAAGKDVVSVACAGPATAEEHADRGIRVAFSGTVTFEHPLGLLTCERAEAWIRKGTDGHELMRAVLDGDVRIEFRGGTASGLESVSAAQVVFSDETTILCRGPVRGTWRGPLEELGVGERVLAIEAAAATLRVRRSGNTLALVDADFEAVRVTDRDGAGHVAAEAVRYVVEGPRIEARGGVEARTPDGLLQAAHVDIARTDEAGFRIEVRGAERLEYVADGKLGPLGDARRGRLHVTCKGRIIVTGAGERVEVDARDEVAAFVDDQTRLEAEEVRLVVAKGALASFRAEGRVRLRGKGAVLAGSSIDYDGSVATARGATLNEAAGRSVGARTLVYREDRTFRATGSVVVMATLGTGPWTVRCDAASGALGDDGKPSRIEASGAIRATGPEGEEVEGERFRYAAGTGVATLEGAPARVRRGADLFVEAQDGFALRLEKGAIAEARTRGAGRLVVRGALTGGRGIAAWHADLNGPVEMRGDTVVVPKGARMRGVDGAGATTLEAAAGRIRIDLERDAEQVRPVKVTGDRGVTVEDAGESRTKVTARRLAYAPGTRRVDVFGDARVEAPGWPHDVRFRHVVFVVKESGIDLKRASEIEVIEKE